MLIHPTLDQLRALKLDGMVQAFIELAAQEEVRNLAHAEWLALLLDREAADRNTPTLPDPIARRSAASQPSRNRKCRLPHTASARQGVVRRAPSGRLFGLHPVPKTPS